jgi:hypothetical protein
VCDLFASALYRYRPGRFFRFPQPPSVVASL